MFFIKKYIEKYRGLSKRTKIIIIIFFIFLNLIVLNRIVKFLFNIKLSSNQKFVVAAALVVQKTIPINVSASGKAQPLSTVMIKSQVDGVILNSFFKEGEMVNKGQLLFEIDPGPFNAIYNQAIANLAKEQANLTNRCLQLKKYEKLYKNKFVSDLDYQQILANFKAAEASVGASMAAVDAAKIQLDFTKIISPITGVAGQIFVQPGNVVKAASGVGLVNINQLNPAEVLFYIPEKYLCDLIKNINKLDQLTVKLDTGHVGKLIFFDNQVNSLSGMIALKAEFCNCNLALWPGKFVNVTLTIKNLANTVVAPARSVQVGQQGAYVYIAEKIKSNKNSYYAKVNKVSVKIKAYTEDEIIITEGLTKDQIVVTEGHTHLMDNDIVEIYEH
jgi:membrane fusion protein, multidrug efflux system